MSASDLIFTVGVSGNFEFQAPYNTKIPPDILLTVKTVSSITSLMTSGWNVDELYEDVADPTIFVADLQRDGKVLTLQSEAGDNYMVPQSLIVGYPRLDGVLYRNLALAVNVGPHPESKDFAPLQAAIETAVMEFLGVQTQAQLVATGAAYFVPEEEHTQLEIARRNAAPGLQSDPARIVALTHEVRDLTAIKLALEAEVRRLNALLL